MIMRILSPSILIVGMTLLCGVCYAQFAGGNGTINNPYQVSSPEHLNNVRYYLDAYYVQINDIDLQTYLSVGGAGYNGGSGWMPIGTEGTGTRFSGRYNGNGYQIKNLRIYRPQEPYIGLFGFLNFYAIIQDLGLVEVDVTGSIQVGALVGGMEYAGILNCYATGSVHGSMIVGGLVGNSATGSQIFTSYTSGSVTASSGNVAGGLVGSNGNYAELKNCYSTATVSSVADHVGGLVGINVYHGSIERCYSTGYVQGGGFDVGGLIGRQVYESHTIDSFWDYETSGTQYSADGIGKTTQQMMQQSTFINWNFGVDWRIREGQTYPFIAWQELQMPGFDPAPGVFPEPVSISITHPNPSVMIQYRVSLDGALWTEWDQYIGQAINLDTGETVYIEAYATKPGFQASDIASGEFSIPHQLSAIYADPAGGIFQDSVIVSLSHIQNQARIYFTLDGSTPTEESSLYIEPIEINEDTILKAVAIMEGWLPSPVLEASYEIIPTSIQDPTPPVATTRLYPAYPNPFNPSTNIRFALAEAALSSIEIFNVKGQRVRTLMQGYMAPGEYSLEWNGRDDGGVVCASGIYFYSLRTPSNVETRTMMMSK